MILSGPDSALQWKVFDSLTKKDFYGNVPPPVAISWIMTKTGLNEFVSNAEGGSGKLILSWKVFFVTIHLFYGILSIPGRGTDPHFFTFVLLMHN